LRAAPALASASFFPRYELLDNALDQVHGNRLAERHLDGPFAALVGRQLALECRHQSAAVARPPPSPNEGYGLALISCRSRNRSIHAGMTSTASGALLSNALAAHGAAHPAAPA
jgi:hypothetical protein